MMRWKTVTLVRDKGRPLLLDECQVFVLDLTMFHRAYMRWLKKRKYFYLALICFIAIVIVVACMASIYYKMPERGIPL